ncbi:hypothetical protein [Cupriavidus plantarum]|uniref:hypothetical protein n=1 Tax=Cupriavidus plantarum TaxID=942865 RepID=UPI00339D35A9
MEFLPCFRAATTALLAAPLCATLKSLAGASSRADSARYAVQRANMMFDVAFSHTPLKMHEVPVRQVTVMIDVASIETLPYFLSSVVGGRAMLGVTDFLDSPR